MLQIVCLYHGYSLLSDFSSSSGFISVFHNLFFINSKLCWFQAFLKLSELISVDAEKFLETLIFTLYLICAADRSSINEIIVNVLHEFAIFWQIPQICWKNVIWINIYSIWYQRTFSFHCLAQSKRRFQELFNEFLFVEYIFLKLTNLCLDLCIFKLRLRCFTFCNHYLFYQSPLLWVFSLFLWFLVILSLLHDWCLLLLADCDVLELVEV